MLMMYGIALIMCSYDQGLGTAVVYFVIYLCIYFKEGFNVHPCHLTSSHFTTTHNAFDTATGVSKQPNRQLNCAERFSNVQRV